MPRGLDHVVHAVNDLDVAATLYRRLGFLVGARNHHPWGTHNHIVQLAGFFFELLTVAEPEKITEPGPNSFSFGAFNRSFLSHGEGLSMLALESGDAGEDAARFRAAGIGDFEPFRFERVGQRPDGSTAKLVFSLAFAVDTQAPQAGFFTCQHHHPENFWNPAFQHHPNGVAAIGGVDLVAENPTDHHIFLSAFAGERELLATSTGITVSTPRGDIRVMDPDAFRIHYGIEPSPLSAGARIDAIRCRTKDFTAAVKILKENCIDAQMRMGRIIVGPSVAMGATIVFEPM